MSQQFTDYNCIITMLPPRKIPFVQAIEKRKKNRNNVIPKPKT